MKYEAAAVSLSRISGKNETYRITTRKDLGPLASSIETAGLINPPILAPSKNDTCIVISGFRRIAACRQLGQEWMEARVTPPGTPAATCAAIAITDNCLQRELNLIEMSRAVRLLGDTLPEGADIPAAARQAGLPLAAAMLSKVRPLCELPEMLQQGVIDAVLALPMAGRLQQMDVEEAMEVYRFFGDIRAGLNIQRELLDHAEECARREGVRLVDILKSTELAEIRASREMDRARRTGVVRKLLKERRYPELSRAEALFDRRIGHLELPLQMKLTPPAGFEGSVYRLSLAFEDLAQLREQKETLGRLLENKALAEILA